MKHNAVCQDTNFQSF